MDTDPRFGMYGYNKTRGQTIRPVKSSDPSSVNSIKANGPAEIVGISDLQGHKIPEQQKGVNIIRMSDGTTKKVVIK